MIKLDITLPIEYSADTIKDAILYRIPVSRDEISEYRLLRRTLDLSDTKAPRYKCTVALTFSDERETGLLKMRKIVKPHIDEVYTASPASLDSRPVVVGAGPAGLFAALALAEAGTRPIILERGRAVEEREKAVKKFAITSKLDPECNVQFGEGGAGAFSDGKLKFGSIDKFKTRVIRELIESGATEDIAYSATAHLGTNRLPIIVRCLREKIISLGGEFIFSANFKELKTTRDELSGITYEKDGEIHEIPTSVVILAIGHSARDTIRYLYNKGLPMIKRGFGIGMRVEHPREYINKIVYKEAEKEIKESASYHLVTHLSNGRSVYSFCMCPGGTVVAATSNEGSIVTNGMSEFSRDADNSNSAILVSVTPEDFESDNALAGIEYQEKIERAAYSLTNTYCAPTIRLSDLLENNTPKEYGVMPSYPLGTVQAHPNSYMPSFILESIKAGFSDFDSWLSGFALGDAVLTGPETRTTSPIRIIRTETGEVSGFSGVYPAGEGAGYAGGIVSSAVDGLREAELLLKKWGK